MKYSLEDAKKMMAESSEKSQTKTNVDAVSSQTNALNNLLVLARRAKDAEDYENAKRYYEQILMTAPNDWEAIFYSAYCQAMGCKVGEVTNAAILLQQQMRTVYSVLLQLTQKQRQEALLQIGKQLFHITVIFCQSALNYYKDANCNSKLQ